MPRESPAGLPPALVRLQRSCNLASADRWEQFAEHRARLTELALHAAPAGGQGRLAVLGAGNGNDLDLTGLAGHFREVHLFDLDAEALARARRRHPTRAVVLRAPIDLSGMLPLLPALRRRPTTLAEIAHLPRTSLETVLAAIPERFDVVLSACLLTQILHGAHVALGSAHPHLTPVSCALVLAHARLLARLVRPEGIGLLVTDTVSAQSPLLDQALTRGSPADLLADLEAAHLCAAGTGPSFLHRVLAEDHAVGPLIEPPTPVAPWPWRWSAHRSYLVHGLAFRARAAGRLQ
jgi:hypothetical protein